jgi:nitrate reductase (cytochrome)
MSGVDRRAFLRGIALASAAAAASALMPGVFFGDAVRQRAGGAPEPVWKKAPCLFCGVGCGLLVGLEGGRAVAVRGDPESPVNRGLACVKGYHSIQALYGGDRVTRAMVRRDGRLVEVPIQEALDLVALRLGEAVAQHGKESVALYGSGQWSIPAGYAAAKLFKGALGTNNLDADTRIRSGGVMEGLKTSFGMDASLGSFEDLDEADVFVLWGGNLAELHPVLFSRILERRRTTAGVIVVAVGTRATRTSYAADRLLLLAPHTEIALANAVANELVERRWVDRGFVERHVAFKRGRTGARHQPADDELLPDAGSDASWEDYTRFLAAYAPERVARVSGVPAADIRWLASLYGDRGRRVVSLWCGELTPGTRGTWANNALHNLHLLTGKVASPGNGPLALSSLPGDCGAVREVGALAERLPGGFVTRAEDRRRAAEVWRVPEVSLDSWPGRHAVSLFRAFGRGEIRFLWIQGSDPMVNLMGLPKRRPVARREDRFVVVSETYPTPTTEIADVVLPTALWIEEEGLYGSAERRTQHFEQMVQPPGDAMGQTRQTIEVARRLGFGELFPWQRAGQLEGIWSEYTRFHESPAHRLAPLAELRARPGVLWPYVDGRETRWRYSAAHDPAADHAYGAFDFYGHPDHRAWIWLRPHEPAAEATDAEFPFRLLTGDVLEHSQTGALTRRIPTLHGAVPTSYVEVNAQDAKRLGIRDRETVRLVSRRGSIRVEARIDYRSQPPPGVVFVPVFDEARRVNELTLDDFCPLSGQPGSGSSAVRVERLGAGGSA